MEKFDLLVLGGGPGGYLCAERAAQNGMNVAVFEKKALFQEYIINNMEKQKKTE